MIELPELYDHQADQRDRLRAGLVKYRSVIAQAPPGTGKTRMAKWMLASFTLKEPKLDQSGYAVFAVHRRGLVDNAHGSFEEHPPLPHGLIMSGRETLGGLPVQVASIDTLLSWFCEGGDYHSTQTYDLIVFDETHSHLSKLKTFLAAHAKKREELSLKPAFVLGLTATPQCEGLNDVYKAIIPGPKTKWLIDNNFLSPFRYYRATEGQLDKLVKRGDEFTKKSVNEAMSGLSGDLLRDWKKIGQGRATVGFFPRLAHAKEAQLLLLENGIRAGYVDGKTADDERRQLFRDLNTDRLDYICNVGVIERGTDIPLIGCIQVCTAVGSATRWLQMIGRGSRVHPESGKENCIIIDHGGNTKRHGFFEDDLAWNLDWSSRPDKEHEPRAMMECPKCGVMYRGGKCLACGYEPSDVERSQKGLMFDGATLVEVKAKTKPKKIKTNEEIMIIALYMCGKTNRTFRQAIGIAYGMAKSQGRQYSVPSSFEVAGKKYIPIPRGARDADRRVSDTYGFTVKDYSPEANPYRRSS